MTPFLPPPPPSCFLQGLQMFSAPLQVSSAPHLLWFCWALRDLLPKGPAASSSLTRALRDVWLPILSGRVFHLLCVISPLFYLCFSMQDIGCL